MHTASYMPNPDELRAFDAAVRFAYVSAPLERPGVCNVIGVSRETAKRMMQSGEVSILLMPDGTAALSFIEEMHPASIFGVTE